MCVAGPLVDALTLTKPNLNLTLNLTLMCVVGPLVDTLTLTKPNPNPNVCGRAVSRCGCELLR